MGSVARASTAASQRLRPSTMSAASGTAMARRIAVVTVARRSESANACQSIAVIFTGVRPDLASSACTGGREQKVEQLVGGGALPGVADDDRALLDGRIEVAGNDEVGAVSGEARRERRSERDEAGVGVGGVGKLRGLRDIFGGDELRLESVVELEALQRGDCGAAIGCAIGIGDGQAF